MRRVLPIIPALTLALLAARALPARPGAAPAESGVIRLHLLGHEIGTERYEIRASAGGSVLTDTFEYTDRGGRVALTAELSVAGDLTPRHYRAKGRSYRFLEIDADVEVTDGVARVRSLGDTDTVDLPEAFFTVHGYAPLAVQALLVRYWERHGRPARLATVPGAPLHEIAIEKRGVDSIRVGGHTVRLRRYTVDGVAWGVQVLWLDEADRMAAVFTRANILPFEGIRDDLAPALSELEAVAIQEFMAHFARISADVPPVADGSFALAGGRLIDGTGRTPIEDATVVIRSGRIAAAGASALTPIPAGTLTIDARGSTIIPGLWDMHGHPAQVEWGPAYLAAGVTTARGMGGEMPFEVAFRDAIAAGAGAGPRLVLAGLVDGPGSGAFGTVTAASPVEGRAVVDRYHGEGFEQIKLYTQLAPDVARAIIERAHELNMTVTGHIPRSLTLEQAVEAGLDHIAHLPQLGPPGSAERERRLRLLRERGTIVDPTLSWNELLGRSRETPITEFQPGISRAPWPIAYAYGSVRNEVTPAAADSARRRGLEAVRALRGAGIPIVAGTDYGVPGHSLHRELELYVAAGLSPMDAILSATSVPAEVMGMRGEVGTVEPGMRADLLVLDGDPLADIANIRRGRWVVAAGRMYETGRLWSAAGFRPPE